MVQGACRFDLRQRSEQNFTRSQSRSHFFRHVKGRPQHWQSFWGRCSFFTPRMHRLLEALARDAVRTRDPRAASCEQSEMAHAAIDVQDLSRHP